ncbi:hypothetical protein BJ508DRAFT_330050 [Ascobolus immersus RN42]|uniref:MYND-type domain-containing protein n=1 Tax=Ascobolus immersus RN42 TaxID=1160509 RepID=A0A3N4HV40_ASCIM|nr:hypothetical protein BJ508DRAFT_330050 [Ascobolus immersus RN42]
MPPLAFAHEGKTVWVKIHPKDTLEGINPVFLTNPEEYVPQRNPETGMMEEWGVVGLHLLGKEKDGKDEELKVDDGLVGEEAEKDATHVQEKEDAAPAEEKDGAALVEELGDAAPVEKKDEDVVAPVETNDKDAVASAGRDEKENESPAEKNDKDTVASTNQGEKENAAPVEEDSKDIAASANEDESNANVSPTTQGDKKDAGPTDAADSADVTPVGKNEEDNVCLADNTVDDKENVAPTDKGDTENGTPSDNDKTNNTPTDQPQKSTNPLLNIPDLHVGCGDSPTGCSHIHPAGPPMPRNVSKFIKPGNIIDPARAKRIRFLYPTGETPEEKWVARVAAARGRKINCEANQAAFKERQAQDYVLKVTLLDVKDKEGTNFCHRVIQVSGAIPLNVLVDKVLLPAMGWLRNYHGYTLVSQTDGTVYGPNKMAVFEDMKQMPKRGVCSLDDEKYTLAHLLADETSSIMFNYDLVMLWRHHITVEQIIPADHATGRILLVSGFGACPPEDMNLNPPWQTIYERILSLPFEAIKSRADLIEFMGNQHIFHSALNYRDLPELQIAITKKPFDYDPYHFDLPMFQKRMAEAIASRLSDKTGPKMFAADPHDVARADLGQTEGFNGPASIGCRSHYVQSPTSRLSQTWRKDDGPWFLVEHVRIGEEPKGVCASCGFAGVRDGMVDEQGKLMGRKKLAKCSKCRGIWYCGRECQTKGWAEHKRVCRTWAMALEAALRAGR